MRQLAVVLMAVLTSQVYSAPQLISVNDGKLGVNFGGYHAAVGLGGLLGGGAGGGLFAEAGTPHGQSARAGLGGSVDGSGASTGGLYAGATAGGNVKAETGLSGGITADKSTGNGFASAQAGKHYAAAGLGGEASGAGASGFTFSGAKTIGATGQIDSNLDVKPLPVEHKKVHKVYNVDAEEEVKFVPLSDKEATVRNEVQPQVIVKEVSSVHVPKMRNRNRFVNNYVTSFLFRVPTVKYRQRVWWTPNIDVSFRTPQVYVQPPPQIIEKHIIQRPTKPRHHFRTAYIGGYIGGAGNVPVPTPQPIAKRIDVGVNAVGAANSGVAVAADTGAQGHVGQTYTKQVTFQRNPNFFADIFNIPISTLQAVGNFLSNTAGSTSVSVQKTGSVQAETESITPKHAATSSASSSDAHVSIQTPNVSKVIDDIFAIPINTLGAVNKFLENNVPARKAVQASVDGAVETGRVRLGPHARRRANQQVIVVNEENEQHTEKTD